MVTKWVVAAVLVIKWCLLMKVTLSSTTSTTPTTQASSTQSTNNTNATSSVSNSTQLSTTSSPGSTNQTLNASSSTNQTQEEIARSVVNYTSGEWAPTLEALYTSGSPCDKLNKSWCKLEVGKTHGLSPYVKHLYNLSYDGYNALCETKKGNYGFVWKWKFTFTVTTGPERILLKDVQCSNVVYDGITKDGYLIHFLFGGRRVHFTGCKYAVITKNCKIESSEDGPVPLAGYGNWTTATYSLFLQNKNANEACKIKFPCLNKGKALGNGGFELKGYFTTGLTRPETSGRRLLSTGDSEPEDDCGTHSHMKQITNHHLITDFKDGPGDVVSICNGTHFFHGRMPNNLGCYSIRSIKVSHHCGHHKTKCTVEPELKQCSHGKCISIRMSNKGIVRLSRGSSTETIKCGTECLIPPLDGEGDIIVDCPGGTQHFLQRNIVDLDCPTYPYFQEFMLYICRASHRPKTTIGFFLWMSVGYIILSACCSFALLLLRLLCKGVELCKTRFTSTQEVCEVCKQQISGNLSKQLHEANCKNGLCPYCSNRLPESSLYKHAEVCPRKKPTVEAIREHENYNSTPWLFVFIFGVSEYSGTLIKRSVWIIVLLSLLLVALSPVYGEQDFLFEGIGEEQLEKGLWEDEVELVEGCHQECFVVEAECLCPSFQAGRQLLFYHLMNKQIRTSNKLKLLSSVSLETPWGVVKIEKGFKPTSSMANLQLSWSSEEEVGGKVILSGKSTSIIKLKERTGMVWELSSSRASEKKKLIVSIMDFSQEYKTQFQYLTGDRLVSEWPRATCTGPCPDRCACHTSTCTWKTWPNSRKWTCNPTWCWGVGTGCTCCGMDVEKPFQNYLVAKWSTEYIKTDVIVCVEVSEEERHCDLIQAGSRFHLGPVTVLVSDPQSVAKKLPSEIITLHKVQGGEVDLMHVNKILTANSLCKPQSCTHGSPGDIQIFKPDYLVKYSISKRINAIEDHGWANDTWMSWQGSDLDYYCTTGSWPTCTFSGVVKQNSDAFKNLETLEFNLMEEFFFHSSRVEVKGRTLGFPVKSRPKEGGGELSVLVEVNGLELHSKLINPLGLSLKITSCKGCYSCSSGFYCDVVLNIEEPPEMTVHVECNNPNIVLTESSLIAKSGALSSSKVKGFSALRETRLCLILQESKVTKKEVKDCIDIKLEEPKDVIIERGSTLLSHQNDSCTSGFRCWLGNAKSFSLGLGMMFQNYFGSIIIGLIIFILPVIALLVFFCLGKRILICRRLKHCFRSNLEDKQKFKQLLTELKHSNLLKIMKEDAKSSWRGLANKALGKTPKMD
uniref:M polyprotein n=1 Tax=Erve virus TaxID=248062 RepID=A0A191KW97_9VIRU|nr:glycoprotein precursor [Erve virus]